MFAAILVVVAKFRKEKNMEGNKEICAPRGSRCSGVL